MTTVSFDQLQKIFLFSTVNIVCASLDFFPHVAGLIWGSGLE